MADKKKIDTNQVLGYLNPAFLRATANAAHKIGTKATRTKFRGRVTTTPLYDYQVRFCYLIDDIQRSPAYIIPMKISEANELLDEIERLTST